MTPHTRFLSLRLSDLPEQKRGVLRAPSPTRPALWLIEENGVRAVVKDYSVNRFFYRNVIGRFLIWREEKAYRKLRGLEGVPVFCRVIDGMALVTEEVQGRSVEGIEKERGLPQEFFDEMEALVAQIHSRGLAHCDLKRAPNILLGQDGKPYVVDWSAAVSQRELGFFPLTLLYQRFLQDDFNAITKLQLKHCPERVDPERRRLYDRKSNVERCVRALRDKARDLLQRVA